MRPEFLDMVDDATMAAGTTSGWDFSYVKDRRHLDPTPWSWAGVIGGLLSGVRDMLDMDTGGGEVLTGVRRQLDNWPECVWATEGHASNVPIASRNLARIGVGVVGFESHDRLPFDDGAFDLITNRHGDYRAHEIWRLLRPSGVFVTQQIEFGRKLDFNELLAGPGPVYDRVDLNTACDRFAEAGFSVIDARQFIGRDIFDDVGAIVFVLTMAPWEVPDFSVDRYRSRLLELHDRILRDGPIDTGIGYRLLTVQKPT